MSHQTKLLGILMEQYVPKHLTSQVEETLEKSGFKLLQECMEKRGSWHAVSPRTGHELVANQYHISIYAPTGVFEEVSAISSFSTGVTSYSMEKMDLIKRFPLREDSDE